MTEFEKLLDRGTPDDLQQAHEIIRAKEYRGANMDDLLSTDTPAPEIHVNWDRLEKIALTRTPREWTEDQAAKIPAWLRKPIAYTLLALVVACATWAVSLLWHL